ncbi:MAG: bifunctional enoyl-CoA hydratase/phosphate acetyltransferase [Planctomycetota bacterium]
MKTLGEVVGAVAEYPVKRVAVAAAGDRRVIEAVKRAADENIARAVLVGDAERIRSLADAAGLELGGDAVIDVPPPEQAALRAAELVRSGKADVLMKGYIHTDDFLRAVLDREVGLRTGLRMSHVFVAELPGYDRLILTTDAAMNIAPDLEAKAEIILNAVYLARVLEIESPRVACLAAVELLNPAMAATVDATCLQTMCQRGQFEPACVIDGPFAFDNAMSPEAAAHKKLGGPVAGRADVLLVPDIEAGNICVKSFVYAAGAKTAGNVIGAAAPIVLTSRADSAESKFYSIALAVLTSGVQRALRLKIGRVHY